MSQKQRTTFALKNFRGLDKENKLLKVQSYRASDGYNFIIDSETLKTRPSFTLAHNPNFFLEANDYLIDWRLFGETYVYITKKHIYLVNGNLVLNELSNKVGSGGNIVRSDFQVSFDFTNLKPLFQEEKDCLFVFCLNEIFVVSTLKDEQGNTVYLVLYNLREKPTNPFTANPNPFLITIENKFFIDFDKLPSPYVPTVILGSEVFEDVNLLSNQSRYQLFANVPTTILGTTTYNLPTYYNPEKHGNFTVDDIKVSIYKGRYDDFEAFPVFMGVHNEDWFGVINGTAITTSNQIPSYAGTIINNVPFVIENTFFPQSTFEYDNSHPTEQIIFEKYAISKKEFFEFIVKGSENQTVFEFLMSYINTNKTTIAGYQINTVLVFSLRAQFDAILRDNQDRDILSKSVRFKDVLVYVQLKKYDLDASYTNKTQTFFEQITTNTSLAYPTNPVFPVPTTAVSPNIFILNNSNPIQIVGSFEEEMEKLAIARIQQTIPGSNTFIAVQAKLYKSQLIVAPTRSIFFPTSQQDEVLEVANYTYSTQNGASYPNYPPFNPGVFDVKEFTTENVAGSTPFTFLEGTTERARLITLINNYINNATQVANDGFDLNLGFGVFKMRMGRSSSYQDIYDPITSQIYKLYKSAAVIVKVSISPSLVVEETRRSITYQVQVIISATLAATHKVKKVLKEDKSIIELKVRDFFYDYKNEPSIEVLVSFQQNTDYNIISQSKFGATFGSENRLFLAGNSEFPNVDRFNVSNDLLGLETKNQSYELTYFPSKNFRVLGGKGAINGYVVATDSQLYITKENYPNDSKLFIRQRNISEQGQVNYNEFKTNITKSPLNNRCLVRFFNDILVLSKDGLFGIEISQNVLTDERLVKLRSGFINKDLVDAITNYDNSKIFIVENDIHMYIVIGDRLYLADSRYIAQNPNSAAENVSYEIIEWKNNTNYITAKVIDDIVYFVEEDNNLIYSLQYFNSDDLVKKGSQDLNQVAFQNNNIYSVFNLTNADFPNVFISPSSYVLKFLNMGSSHAYILKALVTTDYTVNNANTATVTMLSPLLFTNIQTGSKLYWYTSNTNTFTEFTLLNLTATTFQFNNTINVNVSKAQIYQRVTDSELYIKDVYTNSGTKFITLTNRKPDSVNVISSTTLAVIEQSMNVRNNIVFSNGVVLKDVLVIKRTPINLRWVSAITDFGVSQMEKTSFRVNLYATKKEETNTVTFGYRTMRRMAGLSSPIDLSNNFDFNEVNYNQFTLASFDTVAISLPMKENNFLYIQFTLNGVGKIEMNAIEVIYKNNRMLKSIG